MNTGNTKNDILNRFREAMLSVDSGKHCDHYPRSRGSVKLYAVYGDGRIEPLVTDPNLVVTTGRRVMSRLISGAVSSPTLLHGVLPALRIIRTTAVVENIGGACVEAWARVYQIEGTATYRIDLVAQNATTAYVEWSLEFPGNVYRITDIAAAINATANWTCEILNSLDAVDASLLLTTHDSGKHFALGDEASYSSIGTDPRAATLNAYSTGTESVTAADLYIEGVRFGTEGHDPATPTSALDVQTTDEDLRARLRAIEYGGAAVTDDVLDVTVSYPNPQHVTFTSVLTASQANGRALSEVGLYTADGVLVAKKNFGQITKSALFSIVCEWTLLF